MPRRNEWPYPDIFHSVERGSIFWRPHVHPRSVLRKIAVLLCCVISRRQPRRKGTIFCGRSSPGNGDGQPSNSRQRRAVRTNVVRPLRDLKYEGIIPALSETEVPVGDRNQINAIEIIGRGRISRRQRQRQSGRDIFGSSLARACWRINQIVIFSKPYSGPGTN